MDELFKLLPLIIGYLACGAAAVLGFCFLYEKRYNFFSEISLWYILIFGYVLFEVFDLIPTPSWQWLIKIINKFSAQQLTIVKNGSFCLLSALTGFIVSAVRNIYIFYIRNRNTKKNTKEKTHRSFVVCLKGMRRRTNQSNFWLNLLDDVDKPVQLRLINYEKDLVIDGFLLSIGEEEQNPYIALGYCKRYNLKKDPYSEDKDEYHQVIVKPDDFDEVTIIYRKDSRKPIPLNIVEK